MKNKYGYSVILLPCEEMGQIDLYKLIEYVSSFNFPIMETGEILYSQDALDIVFDLKIDSIIHDDKIVYLRIV